MRILKFWLLLAMIALQVLVLCTIAALSCISVQNRRLSLAALALHLVDLGTDLAQSVTRSERS
jgi:hypothetical protein